MWNITLSSEVSSYGSYLLELTGSYKMALAISSEVSQHGSASGGTFWNLQCERLSCAVKCQEVEVIGWNLLDLQRLIMKSFQNFHNSEVLGAELYGTSVL